MISKDLEAENAAAEQARREAFETGNASYMEYQARIAELEAQVRNQDTALRRARAESVLQGAGLSPTLADLIDCTNDENVDAAMETFRHAGLGKWEDPPAQEQDKQQQEKAAQEALMRAAMELD